MRNLTTRHSKAAQQRVVGFDDILLGVVVGHDCSVVFSRILEVVYLAESLCAAHTGAVEGR